MPIDRERFAWACSKVMGQEHPRNGIGTLGEKTLHAVLKHYYEPLVDHHEIKLGGYVADIVGEQGIWEIQTRGFDKLRKKLEAFLAETTVTVVYPIPCVKWLTWIDPATGELGPRHKSPKKSGPWDALYELSRIKPLLNHPNLHILLVLLEVEEYRNLNGWSRDGKRGSTRYERIPTALLEEVALDSPADYAQLIPRELPALFTAKDYQKATRMSPRAAGYGLGVLRQLGVLEVAEKRGNAFVYRRQN